ncbi:hypothetical protein LEP1GSC125_1768 [Leptospira mayottensis 200901122]|uniref:Uncharacterized protein n=1 Tax=Leptospira mayottensis 200901122 TaxID=1193010 RepID=A0AA87MME4_9LEPT|nr:hypothetical protein LEP1GSC125_1768 [Leptospira mayottensis 200901122]
MFIECQNGSSYETRVSSETEFTMRFLDVGVLRIGGQTQGFRGSE